MRLISKLTLEYSARLATTAELDANLLVQVLAQIQNSLLLLLVGAAATSTSIATSITTSIATTTATTAAMMLPVGHSLTSDLAVSK